MIQLTRQVRIGRQGRIKLAGVRCRTACRLTAPARIKVKVGRKTVALRLTAPRGRFTGSRQVSVKVNGALKRTLGKRHGRINLSLRAVSDAGSVRARGTIRVRR